MRLQAALDLYLIKMRQIEDAKGWPVRPSRVASRFLDNGANCRDADCQHYPRLRIAPSSVAKSHTGALDSSGTCVGYDCNDEKRVIDTDDTILCLTYADLDACIDRETGQADHFDHPLILARSGRRMLIPSDLGHPWVDWDRTDCRRYYGRRRYEDGYCVSCGTEGFRSPEFAQYEEYGGFLCRGCADPLDRTKIATDLTSHKSMPGIEALAGRIVRMTPNVLNLSYTSYLGEGAPVPCMPLNKLRSLSVGPLPPAWEAAPTFTRIGLPSLEKLRVSPNCMDAALASRLVNKDGPLPKLIELQWDHGQRYDYRW